MLTHDIIDNRNQRLVDHIRTILPGSESARFAVAYFFLSGMEAVADQLENVRELRLLIGNATNRETLEQIAAGYARLNEVHEATEKLMYPGRESMKRAAEATAAQIGRTISAMDQTEAAERLVTGIARLIQDGRLKVRVYAKGHLHAKAYIFDYGPVYDPTGKLVPRAEKGIAIVGSSNFTLSGVQTNTELNVLLHGNANHAELTRWFDELWNESQDFEEHLLGELERSWPLAQVTPYEVYLKAMVELVRDHLGGEELVPFLPGDDITGVLADFQEQAMRRAVQMIERYGGCFVADVVGMGKSYIGAAVVKHYELHKARPLIICPASLTEMWDQYNEAYQLNARVMSMGDLREDERLGAEWMNHDLRYRHRDFVLVDESHNYRNTDSERYRVLSSYLAPEERRCVFLTATPRNKSAWDIYNQIRLFHQRDTTAIPVDPPNLREYFKLADAGERRLPALLSHVLIRRTRNHILRWYGYDAETDQRVDPDHFAPYREGRRRAYVRVGGRKHFFPRRMLRTIEYSIKAAYSGLCDRLRTHMGRPHADGERAGCEELTYARYGLWNYVLPGKRTQAPYAELQRAGANLRGLMRVMLFKRFESSVYAFRRTVERLLKVHTGFLAALDQGIVPAGEEAQSILYESDLNDEQALVDALAKVSGRYDIADFAPALREDILQDIRVLSLMLDLIKPIGPHCDAKLETLKGWLQRPPLSTGKTLIFSQYADTAQYLYDCLKGGHRAGDIEVVYSNDRNRAAIVGRFAPKANPLHRPAAGTPEINTLIATDVLSEGLNLQDCDKVINYDLHWNPVRLIQRLGRVDRIGSEHDTVYAFNFLPETEVERNLGLREKLASRIREIHETIGEDAAILDPTERINEEAMYAIYSGVELGRYEEDDVDEYVDLQEAEEAIRQIREDQPLLYQRIIRLRDGVRCGKHSSDGGTVVMCRAGRYKQLMLVDGRGEIASRDVPRILGMLKCVPDTPATSLPAGHGKLVTEAKGVFEREVVARRAEREHTVSLSRAQRYVLDELRILFGQADDETSRRQLETLESAFRRPDLPPAAHKELNRIRREALRGRALLEALSRVHRSHRLDLTTPRAAREESEDETPLIVCSEAFIP